MMDEWEGSAMALAEDALADLDRLRHTEPGLADALASAQQEVARLRRLLEVTQSERPSRTDHHCSSLSSAAMAKPEATAARRIVSASSASIPDRITQPPGTSAS